MVILVQAIHPFTQHASHHQLHSGFDAFGARLLNNVGGALVGKPIRIIDDAVDAGQVIVDVDDSGPLTL